MMLDFKDTYDTYSADVYRFAFWLSGNRHDAEDITSETFVRAWTASSPIRTETLKAYLFAIARNLFLHHQRKRKRHAVLEDVHIDPAPGPVEAAENGMALEDIRELLQTLPESDRTAFVLRVQHDLPYEEIARVLGLSLTAVKVKVHRVRRRLIERFLE
jgi:RNA polymerase sigma-70 factor (ECF subfamily)